MAGLWRRYCDLVATRPIVTKASTSAVAWLVGDAVSQRAAATGAGGAERPAGGGAQQPAGGAGSSPASGSGASWYDPVRAARSVAFGFFVIGPWGHAWFNVLDRFVPGKSLPRICAKAALDQTFYAPPLYAFYYTALGVAEGATPGASFGQAVERVPATVATGACVWVPAHLLNFRFVGPDHRVLFTNVVSVCWAAILSQLGTDAADGVSEELAAGRLEGR